MTFMIVSSTAKKNGSFLRTSMATGQVAVQFSQYKIGATSSGQVGSKRKCGQSYADVSELPLSPRVREMVEALLRKFG